ncbi:MAG: DUF2206 domain-containing protein [Methanobacterium sp. ERen5]|nr:MAG: DUF2206 domain-containing protein [Methanobacterium sp. ERen5]
MKFLNPFKINDWNIKYLLSIVILFQVLLWVTTVLEFYNINIPFVRAISAFIALFFLNGMIILRILRIHKLDSIRNLLYSLGLGTASIMFFGMLVDLVYPYLGINFPISTVPLLITFTIFTGLLCYLSFRRDRDFDQPEILDTTGLSVPILAFLLLPFTAIFGTYLINSYQNNILLIIMFFLIATVPFLVAFKKLPKKIYPLAIFSMALTLVLSTSLITNHITGWDINLEFYFTNLVNNASYWNSSIPDLLNAMLSLVIIVPIFSKISGTSIVVIYKVIYPLIFVFIPLGLYSLFKRQTNTKIAFFACFLFISIFMFFLEMPYLARQEIGELFFVLMLMLMVERDISDRNIIILTVVFIPALLVSHYSMDYIYIFLATTAYLLILLRNIKLYEKYPKLGKWPILSFFFKPADSTERPKMRYKLQLILLFSITILYYLLVSSSVLFNLTLTTINNLITLGYRFLFNPSALMAVGIVTSEKSFLRSIALVFHLLIEAIIAVGILALICRRTKMKINENFALFTVMSFVLLIMVLVVPFLAGALNPERFYQIALIFLALFFVIGWLKLSNLLNRLLKYRWKPESVKETSFKIMALFLAISFMFNSGVAYELLHDKPSSMVIHPSMDGPKFNNEELAAVTWITVYRTTDEVHADSYRFLLLNGFISYEKAKNTLYSPNKGSYMFLGTYNLETGTIGLPKPGTTILEYYDTSNITDVATSIYDNGGSKLFI